MILPHCPRCLQAFFAPLRHLLGTPARFRHLWATALAWLLGPGAPKLARLTARPGQRHRTVLGHFLGRDNWDAADVLEVGALRLLRRLKPRRGEVLYLLIDDTRIAKRAKRMAHLSKLWDHKQQRFVTGHLVVCAAWLFRGVAIPWRFVLWLPKHSAGKRYRKTTTIAAELIRQMPDVPGVRVRVLFDAFYLCPAVTGACAERGFTWFSVAARNRALRTARGDRRKLADWAPGQLRHHGRRVRLRRARGWRWLRITDAVVQLSRIGPVRLVLSKRPGDPWKNVLAVVTNEVRLSGREVLAEYEKRWWIEVLLGELRGPLGLGDYQVLDERKIVNHLHLCGLAHQALTHHGLEAEGAQAETRQTGERTLPPLNQRLASLRAAWRRERIEAVVSRIRHAPLRRKVEKVLKEFAEAA
jgi:DDE superfamily endonuclease